MIDCSLSPARLLSRMHGEFRVRMQPPDPEMLPAPGPPKGLGGGRQRWPAGRRLPDGPAAGTGFGSAVAALAGWSHGGSATVTSP